MKNFRSNNVKTLKCLNCNSTNIKKRKNFSHGSGSKGKNSYVCKDCNSSSVEIESNRRNFRR